MFRKMHLIAAAFVALLALHVPAHAETLMKPFILAERATGAQDAVVTQTTNKLTGAGFDIAGTYSPYPNATVIVVTNDALKSAAAKTEFGGYGAVQRVSVTKHNGEVQVAYTNPSYMAAAYRMDDDLSGVKSALAGALGAQGEFGPEEGMSADDLEDYHYMFLMPYFDDPNLLGSAQSHQDMVERVEANLAKNLGGVTKVYRIDIPGKDQVVFGVGLKANGEDEREKDDAWVMSEIDFKDTKSTAHLPIEFIVSGKKAWALDSKFRIAINFSDLSMSGDNSFMNIMGTPGMVQEALTNVAGGKYQGEGTWAQ